MSKKLQKIIFALLIVLALIAMLLLDQVPGLSVNAAAAEATSAAGNTGDIGYYVRAVLPENQIDDTLTYFDLRMAPGQSQSLEVEVVNETGETITVDVQAISASTNRNGIIDYKTPDVRDATLKHPFSELAAPKAPSLTIEAKGSAIARVDIDMPAGEYDGVVLGGLVFTRRHAGEADTEGMSLQNVYSYVLGVKLSENDTAVAPDFELTGIEADTVNYQPAMVHLIRNRHAAIAKGIDLHVVVRDSAGNVAGEFVRQGVDMAPNSVMPLGVTPLTSAGENGAAQSTGPLLAGDYTSEVTLEYEGESWTFEQGFTVGSVEAEQVNTALPAAPKPAAANNGLVMALLLSAAAAILLALIVLIVLLLRRRRDEDRRRTYKKPTTSHS